MSPAASRDPECSLQPRVLGSSLKLPWSKSSVLKQDVWPGLLEPAPGLVRGLAALAPRSTGGCAVESFGLRLYSVSAGRLGVWTGRRETLLGLRVDTARLRTLSELGLSQQTVEW